MSIVAVYRRVVSKRDHVSGGRVPGESHRADFAGHYFSYEILYDARVIRDPASNEREAALSNDRNRECTRTRNKIDSTHLHPVRRGNAGRVRNGKSRDIV